MGVTTGIYLEESYYDQTIARGAKDRLESWKTFEGRSKFVNDERYIMVEVSLDAIQEVIDALVEVTASVEPELKKVEEDVGRRFEEEG